MLQVISNVYVSVSYAMSTFLNVYAKRKVFASLLYAMYMLDLYVHRNS